MGTVQTLLLVRQGDVAVMSYRLREGAHNTPVLQ